MSKQANIKILKPFAGYKEGQQVSVETDDSGVPLERFWRRRLRDAKLDNCCELVSGKKSSRKSTNVSSEDNSDANSNS